MLDLDETNLVTGLLPRIDLVAVHIRISIISDICTSAAALTERTTSEKDWP